MEDNRESKRQCIFCDTTRELTITTDCGDICCKCVRLTHRQCCECRWWRLKTKYNFKPDDPDYVMCDECVRHTQ